ncbi:aldo/keto reductase [Chitinivibrio alkaliphilus]|uniref:Aldo/keto reductase n=1 Tax=Chitinivibrio alkaliphilus ACht1 TaxID=1313304 RepID=U7D9Q8_9BACT|nr:aldo/keto reductase [Chitinivibrio alkaliphilus]ERP39129.1 aldo/keto reductase [Chitinivibrio alkaliphilus ACht1]
MKYRLLGKTGIEISEIGLGCWALGGPNWHGGYPNGWAPCDESEVRKGVSYALDHGVTHFDTADVYGDGRAERLLALCLGKRTRDVVIASKVGWFRGTGEHAYTPLNIRHQCEQSLMNLQREVIDLYYFHHGDFGPDDVYLDDAVAEMRKLQEEGKIRAIGQSAYSQKDFKRLFPVVQPDVCQSWAHMMDYHFIEKNSDLMQLCERYDCSFVGFSPLNQGLLLHKYRPENPPVFGEGDHRRGQKKFMKKSLEQVTAAMQQIEHRFGTTPEELSRVALQFVLYHKNVAGVIPGFRTLQHVQQNIHYADSPLTRDDIAYVYKNF